MSNWIEINGAKIERSFFDANVREAKGYDRAEIHVNDLTAHVHCVICGVTIDPNSLPPIRAYKSKGGHVCGYCYDHFLN